MAIQHNLLTDGFVKMREEEGGRGEKVPRLRRGRRDGEWQVEEGGTLLPPAGSREQNPKTGD